MPSPKYLYETAPLGVQEVANGFRRSKPVNGGRAAAGTITFTANPTAGHTITLNGSVWTAGAAADTPNRVFKIEASLSVTLDSLVTQLAASVIPAIAAATYAKSGTTILAVTHKQRNASGNAYTLASSNANGVVSAATLTGGNKGDLLEGAESFVLTTDAGAAEYFVLADGSEGQEIGLVLKTKGAGANAIVTGTFLGGTTLTFDTADKSAFLKWLGGKWRPIYNTGTIA